MDLNLYQCGTSIPVKGRFPLEDRSRERKPEEVRLSLGLSEPGQPRH